MAAGFYGATVATPASLPVVRFVFGWLAITNVVIAVFNLLPASPMDGGRILRAPLARSRPYGSATRTAARIGVGFAVPFAVVGVLNFELILILLAFFIYSAATTESRVVLLDELLEGLTVGDVMTREPQVVDGDATVASFVDRMIRDRQTVYPVRGDDGAIAGVVALEDLKAVAGGDREATTVRSLVRDVPRVAATDDAFDTLAALGHRDGSFAIVETGGRIVGVLSQSDYTHALTMQREFGTKVAQ